MKCKVGFLYFSESKRREDVYRQRKHLQDREVKRFVDTLSGSVELVVPVKPEIRAKREIPAALREIYRADAQAVLLFLPIFVSPALVAHTVRQCRLPCILMGNSGEGTFSQLSQLAAGGAVDQAGLSAKRLPGDISEEAVREELLRHLKAIAVSDALLGSTFGCFGGRSIGISTGTADTAQWQKLFGVDCEHIDQYEIVLRAQAVPAETVSLYAEWIKEKYGLVQYKAGHLEQEHIEKMVRSYIAVKELIEAYELDFVGIKCQPEMSNGYVLQCLAVQLLNDPYDAEGEKQPVACACEADWDGALTMQILKLISGGQPTALQDLFHVSDDLLVLANCGSSASYFACLSECPDTNLCDVHLQPHAFGEAGGAATQFVFASDTFTYARLFRQGGVYKMAILLGKTSKRPRGELEKYSWYRPTAFAEVSIDSKRFMREFGSNHIHCVRGDYVEDLIAFCRYNAIEYDLYLGQSEKSKRCSLRVFSAHSASPSAP